jgi:hypothetical protein
MIPTANKTLPLMLGVFTFVFFMLIKGYRYKFVAAVVAVLTLVAFTYLENFLANTFLMQRLSVVGEQYYKLSDGVTLHNLTLLAGRADLIPYFPEVVKTGGIFGIGPLVAWKIHGSNIVYHNLYYSLYVSFGLAGLVAFIALPFKAAADLFRSVIHSTLEDRRGKILLILFAIILLDQVKVSALRIPFGAFTFAFLLALSVAVARLEVRDAKNI